MVIRHGLPYTPTPFLETKNQLRPLPQMPGIFSFVALKYRNLLPGLTSSAAASACRAREAEHSGGLVVDDQYAQHSNSLVVTICYGQIRQGLGPA